MLRGLDDPLDTTYFRVPFTEPRFRGVDFGCRYFPHCETLLGSAALFDERCRVWTDEELRECAAADFGPELSLESRRRAIEAGDESVAAYLRLNPDMAEAYYKGVLLTGGDPVGAQNMAVYAGLAALGVGVLLIVSR